MNSNKPITWKIVEEVAALLEKSLTPAAIVRHDIKLPVVGKKRMRQCDVVITYGRAPRQTISIVEVQKRDRKPDINTFHGWCHKMQEVGAQHLICVSVKGFPQSIIDEVATRYGPTVRLLTLNEIREATIPGLNLVAPYLIHKQPQFNLIEAGPNLTLAESPTGVKVEFNADDKVFTIDDSTEFQSLNNVAALTMAEISEEYSQRKDELPNEFETEIILGSVNSNLWFHLKGQAYKVVELPIKLNITTTVSNIPLTAFEYHQESIEDVLAWVAIAEYMVNNKTFSVRFLFKKDEDGRLVGSVIHKGGVRVSFLVSPDKSVIEDYIQKNLQKN